MPTDGLRLADGAPPELAALVATVERLHRDYTVSFIAAGDERIFAYGGNGFVVILSDRLFDGLVEIETPEGTMRIEPDEGGRVGVTGAGDAPLGPRLERARTSLERYYARRYWKP